MIQKQPQQNPTFRVSNWEYTFLDNGDWIYKAITKKPVIKEKPAFRVCNEIENGYNNLFQKHLVESVKSITKYLLQ
jgi:hypothetical protein